MQYIILYTSSVTIYAICFAIIIYKGGYSNTHIYCTMIFHTMIFRKNLQNICFTVFLYVYSKDFPKDASQNLCIYYIVK